MLLNMMDAAEFAYNVWFDHWNMFNNNKV